MAAAFFDLTGNYCEHSLTFIDLLKRDMTGLFSTAEIRSCMLDSSIWRAMIARADSNG